MDHFILDTSVFTNPDVHAQFSVDALEGIHAFLELAATTPAKFFMPSSIYEELGKIKDLSTLAADFQATVIIRSPRRFKLEVPADLLYELIDEVRHRVDRGLRVAEELTKEAGRSENEDDLGRLVNKLRGRYRETLRQGILDSREDVDVLLLALELDGVLVSADQGLRKWADKVGVKIIDPHNLRHVLERIRDRGR